MQKRSFSFFLGLSLLVHILTVGLVALTNLQDIFFNKRHIPSSVKVHMAAMPQKQASAPAVEKKATLPKKTSPPPVIKKSPLQKKAPALTKKPPLPKKPNPSETAKDSFKKETATNIKNKSQKSNVTEKANPLKDTSSQEEPFGEYESQLLNSYIDTIEEQTRRNWNLPIHLTDNYFRVQIEVKLNERGEVVEKRLTISSQNELFDRMVLEAVEKSSPFPFPPDAIKRKLQKEEWIVFNLDSR